jgi:hypothetical protein
MRTAIILIGYSFWRRPEDNEEEIRIRHPQQPYNANE